ncbi:MAG: hypothetical protein ACRD09_11450 [Vicinamibacterales bacterium]
MSDSDKGYAVIEKVFERPEMARLLEALDQAAIVRTKAAHRIRRNDSLYTRHRAGRWLTNAEQQT